MRVIVCENYEELSLQGAKLIASQILLKPDCILGLGYRVYAGRGISEFD